MGLASSIATSLSVGRIVYGAAALAAPSAIGRPWIGGVADATGGQVMLRAFGIRDVALGAATLGTIRSTGVGGTGARVLLGLGVLVDVTDALSGMAAGEELPNAGLVLAVAGGAAAAGALALATAGGDDE